MPRDPDIEAAAMIAAAGIDPTRYMSTADEVEQLAIVAVASRAIELRRFENEQLAVLIANKVGEMLGG